MKSKIVFLFLLISACLTWTAHSQEQKQFFIQNYSPKTYQASPQNWSIVQDKRGVMFFGNTDGILEYDGKNWKLTPIENVELRASFNYLDIQFIIPKKEIVSKFIASYIFEPNVALLTEDLISTSNTEENLDICENVLTQNHDLIGTQYFDAFVKLKKEEDITLIAISRDAQLIKSPKDDLELKEEDVLIYIANGKNKHAIFEEE